MRYQASSTAAHLAYIGLCLVLLWLSLYLDAKSGSDKSNPLAEYLSDPTIQGIYKFAGANRFPIMSRLGVLYGAGNIKTPVLYIFLKDTGINIRLIYDITAGKHTVVLILLPGGVVDNGLMEVLKK